MTWADRVIGVTARLRVPALAVAALVMIVAAVVRLSIDVPNLVTGQCAKCAVDLLDRHKEVRRWFSGSATFQLKE